MSMTSEIWIYTQLGIFLAGLLAGVVLVVIVWYSVHIEKTRKEYEKTLSDKDYRKFKEYRAKIGA
jgi:hypothetical protein